PPACMRRRARRRPRRREPAPATGGVPLRAVRLAHEAEEGDGAPAAVAAEVRLAQVVAAAQLDDLVEDAAHVGRVLRQVVVDLERLDRVDGALAGPGSEGEGTEAGGQAGARGLVLEAPILGPAPGHEAAAVLGEEVFAMRGRRVE